VPTPNKFAALDAEVLMALGLGDEVCQGAVDGLHRLGFYCLVTETVLQELADICEKGEDQEVRDHSKNTLGQITNWGFLTPALNALKMGVAMQVAKNLVDTLMPDGEINDGLILAEAAYNECRLFVTRRETILKANREAIQVSLMHADLNAVVVGSPEEINSVVKAIEKETGPKP
jgi:hypothetical protein